MVLIGIAVGLYLTATVFTTAGLAAGVSVGSALGRRVTDFQPPRINPGWIRGQSIEANQPQETDEPEEQKLSSHNGLVLGAAAVVLALLLITGAIAAGAILFPVGLFTTGPSMTMFIASFVVAFLFFVSLVVAIKTCGRDIKRVFSRSGSNLGAKATAKASLWVFVLIGLVWAAFWLFVAGLVGIA